MEINRIATSGISGSQSVGLADSTDSPASSSEDARLFHEALQRPLLSPEQNPPKDRRFRSEKDSFEFELPKDDQAPELSPDRVFVEFEIKLPKDRLREKIF